MLPSRGFSMTPVRKLLVLPAGLLLLLGAAQPATRPAQPAIDHAPFDAILKDIVKGERVDYRLLKEKHLPALDAYIAAFVDVGAPAQPLADYLNLYNAVMLRAVVEKRDANPEWKPSDNEFGVFKEPRVPLKDGKVSLDHLEHEIIRKKYKEPRIHVALNCAAVSCPPLPGTAFTTANLASTLETQMKAFVNSEQRNLFLGRMRTMRLSRIFDWFAADFGGKDKVPDYLAKYRPLPKGDYKGWKVEYFEYDWSLNEVK
jgi:hypothetical protein